MEVILTQTELETAVVEYVEKHAGLKVDNITLSGYNLDWHVTIIAHALSDTRSYNADR